jgi:hypothetical protein
MKVFFSYSNLNSHFVISSFNLLFQFTFSFILIIFYFFIYFPFFSVTILFQHFFSLPYSYYFIFIRHNSSIIFFRFILLLNHHYRYLFQTKYFNFIYPIIFQIHYCFNNLVGWITYFNRHFILLLLYYLIPQSIYCNWTWIIIIIINHFSDLI